MCFQRIFDFQGLAKSKSWCVHQMRFCKSLKIKKSKKAHSIFPELGFSGSALPEKTFSGTFNLRIPPELHAKIVFQAKTVGMNLNSYIAQRLLSL
jgi:predicted HicB family RNase H-like nuclease